ncbi:MAG: glutaminase A [Pseudomonadota bacterium]
MEDAVADAYRKALECSGGNNADYIPFLAEIPSHLCAVAVAACDGSVFEAGDSSYEFAIESISKVFTLALVTETIGPQAVRAKIGANPTGLPFNSVIALELNQGKPMSPLVNAGAISTVSLVAGDSCQDRWAAILDAHSRFAGRELSINEELNASEQATNYHNRAITWLLYSSGTIYAEPMETLDVYTRQCSIMLTTADLAMMGATLANRGVHPVSGERVVSEKNVRHILAQMMMEGLYIASGDFAYTVGLPGKSGVGGGVLAIAPGKLAVAGFSPPLNAAGNSVRGLAAVSHVADALELNLFAG